VAEAVVVLVVVVVLVLVVLILESVALLRYLPPLHWVAAALAELVALHVRLDRAGQSVGAQQHLQRYSGFRRVRVRVRVKGTITEPVKVFVPCSDSSDGAHFTIAYDGSCQKDATREACN
jgi:hypothetical protein